MEQTKDKAWQIEILYRGKWRKLWESDSYKELAEYERSAKNEELRIEPTGKKGSKEA
jgi:hypothetical protein